MENEKPLSHQVRVTKLNWFQTHPNADTLELAHIGGYQVVVKKGEYKPGDLAYFIQPDSIVPEKPEYSFLWQSVVQQDGTVRDGMKNIPVKYRRVRTRRFRGQWSEGLLMPLKHIPATDSPSDVGNGWYAFTGEQWVQVHENEDISDLLGITHYQPPDPEDLRGQNERGPKSPYPRSIKGWLWWLGYKIAGLFGYYDPTRGSNERGPKHEPSFYDIENYRNHVNAFEEGEEIWASSKIHGCQGRFIYQDGHMYAGSRRLWKHPKSKCIWRKCLEQNPWITEWCKEHSDYTLYGEVYPCQGPDFMYGCQPGEVKFAVFDILLPNHEWMSWKDLRKDSPPFPVVPTVYVGPFDSTKIKQMAEGKSLVDGKTINEGIVIKPAKERHVRNIGRLVLKVINPEYLVKS